MTGTTRADLAQQDAYYLLVPLELNGFSSAAAHVRHLVRLLRDRTLASPSAAAIAHVTKLYDRSVPAHPAIVCKKGCSHCCRQRVFLTAPEAFFVARELGAQTDRQGAIALAAGRVENV